MADGAADLAYTSTLALNNGGAMPVFGLGVYQVQPIGITGGA